MTSSQKLQENLQQKLHVAIIMDGNGRWAAKRGRPRTAGHVMGARTVRQIVEASVEQGIGTLTLYAFSSDNWKRPTREVSMLMRLFRRYLLSEVDRCVKNGVRVQVMGRRDRLPVELLKAIEAAEYATRAGTNLDLRIAVDYSARESILMAAERLRAESFAESPPASISASGSRSSNEPSFDTPLLRLDDEARHTFAQLMNDVTRAGPVRDVDLLIRTGGEQRLSDFLLWECAYAELYFTTRMWPEFSVADLQAAIRDFHARERRFGAVLGHDQEAVAVAG